MSKLTAVHKVLIIVVLVAVAGLVVNAIYRNKTGSGVGAVSLNDREKIIADLQTFEITNTQLDELGKERLFDSFKLQKDALNKANQEFTKQGGTSYAGLYWPFLNMGSLNRDAGNLKKAEEAYLFANTISPEAFVPLGDLGDLYFRYLKDYKKGAAYYEQAIAIKDNPYLETYYSELYELYHFWIKDDARLESLLIDGSTKHPDETNILALLGRLYKETGRKDKAIETFQELLFKKPDSQVAKDALAELKQ